MGLFEDVSQFLEKRIDEFLKNNPHLELQALDDKLRDQANETDRLLAELKASEQRNQTQILATAQDVKRWDDRIQKAKAANRQDLVGPAQNHLAGLIREGNQLWGQMELIRDRIKQTQDLAQKIKVRRQEIKQKLQEAQAAQRTAKAQASQTTGSSWADTVIAGDKRNDPLEKQFAQWEADEELQRMKRNVK
jgi:uncharacterized protein (TIGR04376 family)